MWPNNGLNWFNHRLCADGLVVPRSLLLRAARAAGSYCVSLRAPQARGPDGCSSVSGPPRRLVWLMPRHIRHVQPVCSRGYVAKKRGYVARVCRVERFFGRIFPRTLARQRSEGFDRAVNGRMDCLVMSSVGLRACKKGFLAACPKAVRNLPHKLTCHVACHVGRVPQY